MFGERGRIFVLLPRRKICRRRSRRTGARRGTQGWRATPRLALFLPRWQTVDPGREAGDPLQSSSRLNNQILRPALPVAPLFKSANRRLSFSPPPTTHVTIPPVHLSP